MGVGGESGKPINSLVSGYREKRKKKGKGEVDTVILQVTLSTSRYSVHYVLPVTH